MSYRVETDSMGEVQVPQAAYWGAQTQRSLANFCIGTDTFPASFIHAYGLVKQTCAHVNGALGTISQPIAKAIEEAAQDVIEGRLDDQFPLAVWQTGSGTQTNMNLNEVIANRATEILGGERGSKKYVHANDHVNQGQSTNDTFPTVMYVSAAISVEKLLFPAIDALDTTLSQKSAAYRDVIKMGRTHLQDATPISLGQEISGWAAQLQEAKAAIAAMLPQVRQLAIGGTAVGTGLNAHPEFGDRVAARLSVVTGIHFVSAPNKFAALAAHDGLVNLSGTLNTLACALMKIANDVRWLASGPRGGLGEISIAENEPGSSIMPGKVNPTQAEAATMVCCQVMGNHVAVTMAGSQGNFQLNVYKPVMIFNVLKSIRLLADVMNSFDLHCARSITPNIQRLAELQDKSLMLVTALSPYIGYDMAAKVAKKAHQEGTTLKEAVLSLKLMTADEFDARVRPELMLGPNR